MSDTKNWEARFIHAIEVKNQAYAERNKVLIAFAKLCLRLGLTVGIGMHVGADWEDDWRTILFIDLPAGQASWHFHDSEAHLLAGFPRYTKPWDGHSTEEKYRRLESVVMP